MIIAAEVNTQAEEAFYFNKFKYANCSGVQINDSLKFIFLTFSLFYYIYLEDIQHFAIVQSELK